MDARERLLAAVARAAHDSFLATGFYFFGEPDVASLAEQVDATDHDARVVLRELEASRLAQDGGGRYFKATAGLALLHEQRFARDEWYRQNVARRDVLRAAADADRQDAHWAEFQESNPDRILDHPQHVIFAAAKALEWLGLARLDSDNAQFFCVTIEPDGLDAIEDEQELDRQLPVSVTADDEAHERVARDALAQVIRSCDAMLQRKGWTQAALELERGDAHYDNGDYTDAVYDYYAAVESGVKYRLGETQAPGSNARALRKLAGAAATAGIIPRQYTGLFAFLDTIRGPRAHGGGPAGDQVEIGQAEALLMANHARALLLYLGHRP